jgi:hypothetical protein
MAVVIVVVVVVLRSGWKCHCQQVTTSIGAPSIGSGRWNFNMISTRELTVLQS